MESAPPIKAGESCNISGERKFVSIVFADISGFTAMSERMDAEKVTDIMNQCFRRLGHAVYSREGYIDKFMGDCIMALFGAPVAHENDPELAVDCALQMLEELKAFNAENKLDMGISIGINAGFVVAGGVGTDQKLEYTVMGDAVNLAQRLQGAAERNEILVSEGIHRACAQKFSFDKLEPIQVKGKFDPVAVYSVRGRGQDRSEASLDFKDVSIVGRQKEVSVIQNSFKELANGQSQILMISGDPGVGKSRMKLEMKKYSNEHSFLWVEGRCTSLNRETSHFVIIDLMRNLLKISGRDELKVQRQKLLELGGLELDSLSIQLIADFLGVPLEKEEPLNLEPQQKRKALWVALKQVFSRLSRDKPLVLYFEDLHWVDRLSQEFISSLMDHLTAMKVMISGAFRRDFQHEWAQKAQFSQVALNPLTLDQSVEFVQELLGLSSLPENLKRLIHSKSDGNPLYIQEIVKTLVDSGRLDRSSGQWVVKGNLDSLEISATVQGLIASRIDRLDERSKQVLQYASSVGRRFSDRLLRGALPEIGELDEILHNLKQKGLIEIDAESPSEVIFKFHHALMQDVAYQGILHKIRKLIHERIGEALERISIDNLEDQLEALAHHFVEGGNKDKAIHYLSRAGKKMAQLFDNQIALKYYTQAIDLLNVDAVHERADRRLIDLYFSVSEICVLTGDFDTAVAYQEKLLQIGNANGDLVHLCKTYRRLGEITRMRAQYDRALELLHRSLDFAVKAEDFEGQVRTYKSIGIVYLRLHNLDKALETFELGRTGALSLQNPQLIAEYSNDIATVYIERQQWDKAKTALEEAVTVASREHKLKPLLATAHMNLGVVFYYQKDYQDSLAKFKEAAKIHQDIGNLVPLGTAKNNLGHTLMEFNQFQEALQEFQEAQKISESIGNEREVLHNRALIGFLKTKLNQSQEGEAELRVVIDALAEMKAWFWYVDALVYLASHLADSNRIAESHKLFELAQSKADEVKNELLTKRVSDEFEKYRNRFESKSQTN